MSNTMTKKKKQLVDKEFEELKRKAMEPFKPMLTREKQLEHEEKIREKSLLSIKKEKEDMNESELATIKSRANFTRTFNG